MNNLKSYHLSAQLKAELHHKRKSSTPFSAFKGASLPRINFKNIPIKGIGAILGVFALVVMSYIGIKSVYERSAEASKAAELIQKQTYEDHLAKIKSEVSSQATNASGFVALSQQFLKNKDIERAEASARLATEKDPLWRDGYINQGHVLLVANNFEEAKISFEKALRIDPLCGQAHYLLSLTYQELKDNNAAKQSFAKAKQFGFETEIGG